MTITVDGNMNVIADGSNRGRVEDFIANHPEQTGDVMLAIREHHALVNTTASALVEAKESDRVEALAAAREAEARCEALCAVVRRLDLSVLPAEAVDALASTTDRKAAGLRAQVAALEAELAKL